MYRLKAKVLISKTPACNCGGFYHPGDEFDATNDEAQKLISADFVEVIESTNDKVSKVTDQTKDHKSENKNK
jgi:hypothetical protein